MACIADHPDDLVLTPAETIQRSAVVHGDETGWRVNGQIHWLWSFSSADVSYYVVDRRHGRPDLLKFFREESNDIREMVNQKNTASEGIAFYKKTKRLIRDAIRLRASADFMPERYGSRIDRLHQRLAQLAYTSYRDGDT